MNNKETISSGKIENKGGFKVIEVNVTVSEHTLYAVCTPIKTQ